jgi:hypothetical protein
MNRFFLLLPMLLVIGCGVSGNNPADLGFLPSRPQKGAVFRSYNAIGPAQWSNNWTSNFDFTGVSWNDKRTVTAVSRTRVVMAGHFIRPADVSVVFHDRSGNVHLRVLRNIRGLSNLGDIAIADLDQPLPPGVAHYPMVNASAATYKRAVIVTDQTMTASIHRVGKVSGRRVVLGNDPEIPKTYWRNLISGDSGNPAFLIQNGRLQLLTTFTTGGSGTGPFYGDPDIQAAVLAP